VKRTFIEIEEYMKLSREERRRHLDLNESCIEIGGKASMFRGLLAHHLGTTIGGLREHLCHACNNGKCSNPKHLYWGTPADNSQDYKESGAWMSIWQRMVSKYGVEGAKEKLSNSALERKGGHNNLTQSQIEIRKKAIISSDPSNFGWVQRASDKLGISHTQVKRFVFQYMPELEFFRRKSNEKTLK
jgi:hypothetical protein